MSEPDVLITSETAKLPPEVAVLHDTAVPIPAGVVFFQKRFDVADLLVRLIMAAVFGLLALVIVPLGVSLLLDHKHQAVYSQAEYGPLGFGLLCVLAAWMLLISVRTGWRLRGLQMAGHPTRVGTFILSGALVQISESDTTVIPPNRFRGIDGRTLKYWHRDAEKSLTLPSQLVNSTVDLRQLAVQRWATDAKAAPLVR